MAQERQSQGLTEKLWPATKMAQEEMNNKQGIAPTDSWWFPSLQLVMAEVITHEPLHPVL
jgi:hypothetical protein